MLGLSFSPPDSNVTVSLRLLLKYRPCHGEPYCPAIITLPVKTDSLLRRDMTPNSSAGSGPPRPLSVPSDMCKPMTPGWGMRKARRRRPQHTHVACFYSLCLSGRWCRPVHRSSGSLSRVSQLWFLLKISQVLIKPSLFRSHSSFFSF